jgi:hypothetical protein
MTTVLSPYDLAHLVQIVHHHESGHRAECVCGWAADWADDQTTAERAAVEHREVAVGPPTGLDAALSDLLDLQDDLADTVMWLAENWSADLPAPHATSCYHYRANGSAVPGVRLLVYCDSRDTLIRLAGLLDVRLTVDSGPNTAGGRYEHATRSFGRVELHAYHALDHHTGATS